MNISYFLWKEEDGYVIRCLEYPVTTQGDTKEEAIESLREAVELYLEEEKCHPLSISKPQIGKLLVNA